jgi:hypothetical protein
MRKLSITLLALSFTLLVGATGCKKKPAEPDGPAESAGEEIDEAGDEAGDKVEEAGDKVEDAADDAAN